MNRAWLPRGAKPPAWYRVGPVMALAEPVAPAETDTEGGVGDAATRVDVYLFDTIGGWFGLTAEDFVRDIASVEADELVLHINSPGGEVAEGTAIANVLRAHSARVVVRIDGLAASAASVVAMAGDEIVMGIGAQMMVHEARGACMGRAQDMREYAQALESASSSIASTYAARAGGTVDEWRAVMAAETWYTAEEAVTAGLADRVAAADETGTSSGEHITPGSSSYSFWDMWDQLGKADRHDLSGFQYAGREHAPTPVMPGRQAPAADAAGRSNNERSGTVPFLDDVRQRLGVAADADEATVLAALEEALAEEADDTEDDETENEGGDGGGAGEGGGAPEGTVLVDAAQWEATRAAAQRGAAAANRQEREDRERLVDAAIRDGRIAPASRAHWLTQLETGGPGAAATLASLAKGLIPVDEPIGHAGGVDADPLYEQIFGKDA